VQSYPGSYPQWDIPPRQLQRRRRKWFLPLVIAVVLVVAGLLATLLFVFQNDKDDSTKSGSKNSAENAADNGTSRPAEKELYSMFKTAATQKKIRLAFDLWDSETEQRKKIESKNHRLSLAEYDDSNQTYNSVIVAQNSSVVDNFIYINRCLNGQAYQPVDPSISYKSWDKALAALHEQIELRRTDDSTCDKSMLSIKDGKISDGIIPLAISDTQADSWIERLKTEKLFTAETKGTVNYKGKKLLKVSFALNEEATTDGSGNQWGAGWLFFVLRDGIDVAKAPFANLQESELNVKYNDDLHGSGLPGSYTVKGYYLINEATNLPVYSEFDFKLLIPNGHARTYYFSKASYTYPDKFIIDEKTNLDKV
jgi:hypothetical protein